MKAADAEAVLRGKDQRAISEVLRRLPADVDPQLAAGQLAAWFTDDRSIWGFARAYKKLPVPVIRVLLGKLEDVKSPASIFLRVYLAGEADLAAAWERALYRLLSLDTTYAWGSKERRAKLTGLAQEPRAVEALQASVVGSREARLDALAVLALDASEASVDALMPHFERAAKDKDRGLDRLAALRKYASPTPAMTAMLARVDALLDARNAASPALALADHIGVGPVTTFWFGTSIGSEALNTFNVPVLQGSVHIDSRAPDWFSCSLSKLEAGGLRSDHTSFSSQKTYGDTMKLGRCEAEDIPRWLAAAAKKLKCTWARPEHARSNLRGKKRDRVVDWLTSGK